MGYILGINSSHDPSVCLLKDDKLIAAIEEERLNLDKHSALIKISTVGSRSLIKYLPFLSINYVLDCAGIGIDDVDEIIINDCDMVIHNATLSTLEYLKSVIPVKDKSKIKYLTPSSHHLMHAYNAYYQSKFTESIIVVVDSFSGKDLTKKDDKGVYETIFYAKNNEIKEIYKREKLPGEMGIGALYQFFCKLLDFNTKLSYDAPYNYFKIGFDEAGKLMGLASYGKDVYSDTITKVKDGELNIKIKDLYDFGIKHNIVEEILYPENLSNLSLVPGQQLIMPNKTYSDYTKEIAQNYAYFAQKELERAMEFFVEKADGLVNCNNVCIAGGVALNCLANGKLYKKYINKNFFIPFAPADNGNALGACFYGYAEQNNNIAGIKESKIQFKNLTPFLGKPYQINKEEILEAAEMHGFDRDSLTVVELKNEELAQTVAEYLKEEFIVALIEGGSEFGPRALGHRSILASPIKKETKDYLNLYIKKREWFRPLAPVLLEDYKNVYFEAENADSPYMSKVVQLREEYSFISAIKNIDESSRIQTVNKDYNGVLKDIITAFGKMSDVYMLLNTSLNYKGLPILENPLDIFAIYEDIPVDIIVINNYLIYDKEIIHNLMIYDALKDDTKIELANDMLNSSNYYRASRIFEDLYVKTNNPLFLFEVFKILFNLINEEKRIEGIYKALSQHSSVIFERIKGSLVEQELRVFLGVYQMVHYDNNTDSYGLNSMINENSVRTIAMIFMKVLAYAKMECPKSIQSENTKIFIEKLLPYTVDLDVFQSIMKIMKQEKDKKVLEVVES